MEIGVRLVRAAKNGLPEVAQQKVGFASTAGWYVSSIPKLWWVMATEERAHER